MLKLDVLMWHYGKLPSSTYEIYSTDKSIKYLLPLLLSNNITMTNYRVSIADKAELMPIVK